MDASFHLLTSSATGFFCDAPLGHGVSGAGTGGGVRGANLPPANFRWCPSGTRAGRYTCLVKATPVFSSFCASASERASA